MSAPRRRSSLPLLRTFLAGGLAIALLSAAGCAKNALDDPYLPRGERTIRIEVLNLNFMDATLHALRGGERHRLGVVIGKGEATYTMEWPQSLPLQIEIDLLASGSCITRPLQVDPGDIIELQIQSRLSMDPDCIRTGG